MGLRGVGLQCGNVLCELFDPILDDFNPITHAPITGRGDKKENGGDYNACEDRPNRSHIDDTRVAMIAWYVAVHLTVQENDPRCRVEHAGNSHGTAHQDRPLNPVHSAQVISRPSLTRNSTCPASALNSSPNLTRASSVRIPPMSRSILTSPDPSAFTIAVVNVERVFA